MLIVVLVVRVVLVVDSLEVLYDRFLFGFGLKLYFFVYFLMLFGVDE